VAVSHWTNTLVDRALRRVGRDGGGAACPLCDGRSSRELFVAAGRYPVRYCPSCDGAFVHPMPSDDELAAFYSDDRYHGGGHEGFGYTDYLAEGDRHRASLLGNDPRLEALEGLLPDRGRLLDVGCGTGYRLSVGAHRGWEAVGVEPSAWAVDIGRERYGVDLRCGRLQDQGFGDGAFDAVMLEDVIEHVARPVDLAAEVVRVLAPKGVVVISIPNFGSRRARTRGAAWNEVRPPEHLTYLSLRSLERLAARVGLEVVFSSRHPRFQVMAEDLDGSLPGPLKGVATLPAPLGPALREAVIRAYDATLQYPKLFALLRRA